MSRELKFRAWNTHRKVMSDPFGVMQQPSTSNGKQIGIQLKEDLVIMQFTGLYDKKGNEIYEGDILLFKTSLAQGYVVEGLDFYVSVVWSKNNPNSSTVSDYIGFWAKFSKSSSLTPISYLTDSLGAVVVGNMYENAGLLELNHK